MFTEMGTEEQLLIVAPLFVIEHEEKIPELKEKMEMNDAKRRNER